MTDKKSEYDFLSACKDFQIKKNVTREEEIQFSDKVQKINKNGWKQNRSLILTDKAIYNIKNKQLKRRIDYKTIKGITLAKQSEEFVIHCEDMDYDYQFISSKRKMIIEIINKNYLLVKGEEIKLFEINVKTLTDFVTTKKEKEKQQTMSRMPKTGKISVKDYLFGNKSKTEVNVIPQKKGKKKKNIFNNIKVTMDDFDLIKVIGRGSVGKIYLVEYKTDKKYYAMKSMRKDQLVSEGIVDNILLERNILMEGQCPFILSLSFFFQTPERIYYITPYISGGDLFHKLKTEIFFKEETVKFYSAQIAIALQYIHDLGIAYRDLKPENILIDQDGYIKLCDFGSCVKIRGTEKETSFAGSPEYAAPEMITYSGHNTMCDWWSLGILIYELLYGNTPFFNMDKNRMYDLINTGSISYPKFIQIEGEEKPRNYKISDEAKNLISLLLEKDPGNRLGTSGLQQIKKHPFFNGISFDDLVKKKIKAPFKPNTKDLKDINSITNNFDEEYLNLEVSESPTGEWVKEEEFESWFKGFHDLDDEDEFEVIGNNIKEDDKNDKDDKDEDDD
jgi:serum/glucocorticoid-regulated kinase 2